LAWGSPVNEFCLGDRERDPYVSAFCGYGGEEVLQAAYVSPIGRGGHRDGKVIDIGAHKAFGYRHVKGGDVKEEEEGRYGGPLRGADGHR